MGRHSAPSKHAAQRKHAAPRRPRRPRSGPPPPALPILAVTVTGVATAAAAVLGTTQAAAVDKRDQASDSPVTRVLPSTGSSVEPIHRAEYGPSTRHLARSALEKTPVPDSRGMASVPTDEEESGGEVTSTGECEASYYDTGSVTANGEPFDTSELTAAHKTLPFDSRIRVINKSNNRSVVVRINDRGPYIAGRCLDLTPPAMETIAGPGVGTADVRYEVLGK